MSSDTLIVDPTKVVLKLRALALTPSNRAVICRRGVPASLVQFITQNAPDSQVSALAVETLFLLSEEESNLSLLASEPNLLTSVEKCYQAVTAGREKAASPVSSNQDDSSKNPEDEFRCKLKKNLEHHASELLKRLQNADSPSSKSQQANKNSKQRKKHTVQFAITNLVQNKKAIENALLRNPGTISYKFNIQEDYVSVYTRSKTEKLIQELSTFGKLTVLQDVICETEYNNENAVPVNLNGKRPEYLKPSSANSGVSDYKKSLVSVSREDRIKKRSATDKSKDKKNEEEGGGFLKKLTSVFW